jgi:ribosomal protein S18 acetylase RimI-like enzyme
MFNVMLRHGLKHGFVYSAPETPFGVAIWLPPGQTTPHDADLGDAGIGEVAGLWGHEAMQRLGTLVAYLETLHEQLVQQPHWRLSFLGVAPEHQGEGIGGALVDARPSSPTDNTPTYLETFTVPNVRFYEKHGYHILAENDMPTTGLHVWSMLRD